MGWPIEAPRIGACKNRNLLRRPLQRWEAVGSKLDERGRRLFAVCEVRSAGWGGLALVSKITGFARSTINRGEDDLDAEPLAKGRARPAGGGRWSRAVSETDSGLVPALKRLVDPATLGDPMRPLIWVSKSMGKLAAALTEMGHQRRHGGQGIGEARLLAPVQSQGGGRLETSRPQCPVRLYQRESPCGAGPTKQPVVSVDTRKKELIGDFKNGGTDYRPKGTGFVSVGITLRRTG
jgi:hypothetical protein